MIASPHRLHAIQSSVHIFFFICRVVRLTSPNLNYLIIAGALLLYASVVFIVTPTLEEETATIYCNVSVVIEPQACCLRQEQGSYDHQ